jgi:hypothetical protein
VVRILWFKETSRWSRRGIPLRVVWVSPRQLTILVLSFLFGFGLSVPLPNPTLKLVAMASILLAGAVVSFWRVKMLTTEQLMMARLRGSTRISHRDKGADSRNKPSNTDGKPEESAFEIVADGPESFTPLSVSGRCRRTKLPRKVSLCVDGMPRPGAESLAIPVNETESSYTLVFLPTVADLGTHDLEVRVEGEDRPVYKVKVDVKVKGTRSLEMKMVS